MSSLSEVVRQHYEAGISDQDGLLARLTEIVVGLDGPLTAELLAPLDQFHLGGLAATAELARRAGVEPDMVVLDAGSGFGGPSRYLARRLGCRVTGVDLAPGYVKIATLLSARAGLDGLVDYRVVDLNELSFDDATFDLGRGSKPGYSWSRVDVAGSGDGTLSFSGAVRDGSMCWRSGEAARERP